MGVGGGEASKEEGMHCKTFKLRNLSIKSKAGLLETIICTKRAFLRTFKKNFFPPFIAAKVEQDL